MMPTENNTQEPNPFEYRTTPKNNWELVWWAFSGIHRIEKYMESLKHTFWQERRLFLWVYFCYFLPVLLAIIVPFWILGLGLVAGFDLPITLLATGWDDDFSKHWQTLSNFGDKWLYLLSHYYRRLVIGLVFGFVIGLFIGLAFGFVRGLLSGLVFSFVFGLIFSLFGGVSFGFGLGLGFIFSFVFGLGRGLGIGLSIGLGIVDFLEPFFYFRLNYNFTYNFNFTFGLLFSFFVLYLYFISKNINALLRRNVYLKWKNIDVSLSLEKRFIHQTQENPVLALHFVDFLFANRQRNKNLAGLLAQVATATLWKQASVQLNSQLLRFSGYEIEHFREPDSWQKQIDLVHQSLVAVQTENQISIKKRLFEDFMQELEKMYKLTLTPFPYPKDFRGRFSVSRNIDWYKYYREAMEEWKRVAKDEYENITEQAKLTEPMASNVYKIGDKLTPTDSKVFIDRQDLRNSLSRQLYTTNDFSALFLQGQRRVGKSSLINFFPQLLGSRFEVVYLSLEGNIKSVPDFLQKLYMAFAEQTHQEKTVWQQPVDWSDALHALYKMVNEYAQTKERRVILAIDEYEYLHPFLQAEPERGKAFLGTFRHYLQGKGSVSLMWIGLHFFSELQSPNWNEAFVNVVRIEVPYLTQPETYQLIDVAELVYPAEVKAEIFRLTQGHPTLVQKICFAIVDIANRDGRRAITEADLQEALKRMIYIQDNNVTDVFWSQVCQNDIDRAIVWAVREGKPVPRTVRHRLRRLEEYGFIIPAGEGYKIRVPIFEYWIDNFTQYFDLEKMEV